MEHRVRPGVRVAVVAVAVLALGACTRSDEEHAKQAVKKELKNDADFVKKEAIEARKATQEGVAKVKKEVQEKNQEK